MSIPTPCQDNDFCSECGALLGQEPHADDCPSRDGKISPATIHAAIIEVDGTVREVTLNGYDDYSKAVGGYIEAIPFGSAANAYCNEEGKLRGLPFNERATKLCRERRAIFGSDFVVGPLLIVGPVNENGDDTDIPAETLKIVKFLCA